MMKGLWTHKANHAVTSIFYVEKLVKAQNQYFDKFAF